MKNSKPICLYKNAVKFQKSSKDFSADIVLLYMHHWIEVYIGLLPTDFKKSNSEYLILRETVFQGLRCAAEVHNYHNMYPEIALKCPCLDGDPTASKPKQSVQVHLASISHCGNLWYCTQNEEIRGMLSAAQKMWLDYTQCKD